MKILMIGGSRFIGRHITEALLQKGHTVTLFNRGQFAPELFPQCEKIHGDRTKDLHLLRGKKYDAVIDTCGYLPKHVSMLAQTLKPQTPFYVFISSKSVYADQSQIGLTEESAVAQWEHIHEDDQTNGEHYGPMKAACERSVLDVYGSNASLIIRPGLIVGPHDYSDRFTYWPHRIARGGKVLSPVSPSERAQIIDARDLALWIVKMTELRTAGIFQAGGATTTIGEIFRACRTESGSNAEFVWANAEFLKKNEVGEWVELPLWIASPQYKGLTGSEDTKAQAHGLTYRPISETIRDTLAWSDFRNLSPEDWKAGLHPQKEKQVLEKWAAAQTYIQN
ncbi:NAD-dependent epimerase/dehydratase family protein [Fictibacillus aquaticus]|uniref:UDP-glucose 4-epimerase n=1 Tax=Fictibacillus aquaticus TaxID=2021314 RepID=A0A235FE41_9BACL|nr:NAD-dependent epimerase/dehydratase family protein [Fictibacillus aquaticus]OYD59646.1 hypothetical protein CGZ90_07100 [Fictibacillus aquaticus]